MSYARNGHQVLYALEHILVFFLCEYILCNVNCIRMHIYKNRVTKDFVYT
ncbi:hypothetical protein M089_5521 [Bacteroides ovatus str. 3725 D9 iii]|nr:hypothetical protein M089_5521 [Bacteroides ovatus str. 3725 D9 iii]